MAVVGRTGAGKSSLYQLLLGFRQPESGRILLDRNNITQFSLKNLRSEISVVLQHPFVVQSDTIKQNLDPKGNFTDKQLRRALEQAALANSSLGAKSLQLESLANELSIGQ